MATFTYTALNKDGKKETATIEAASSLAAGHLLKEQGLLPLDLSEQTQNSWVAALKKIGTVSLKEKVVFIQDLQVMIKSGIPAPRGLKIIAKQTKNARFKKILTEISAAVEAGKPLHEAMENYPKVFSNIFVSMIKVGELSGNLDKSLEYLGVQLEREADLKSKTMGAMIYPAVIVSAMVIIGLLMAIFVLPKLTGIFKEFNTTLPLSTRIVIWIADFMSGHAVIVLVGLGLLIVGVIWYLRTDPGKRTIDWLFVNAPVLGPIARKINLARFARVLSSLLKSGIAIVEGLRIAGESVGNIYYSEVILHTSNDVKLGKQLTQTLSTNERLFPFLVIQMLEVGEETGTLETILEQLAVHYETEVDDTMRNLSAVIEPILLLVIGGVVGLLAVALIGPIYNISQSIQ